MTKGNLSITYENNIFHCAKDSVEWISLDGKKWYCEEKRIKELKQQIEKMINEIDKTMCLSNMREREIYDIQEIFRKYGYRRNDSDKWELAE